jgi:hypothetical protein
VRSDAVHDRERMAALLSDMVDGAPDLDPALVHQLEHDLRFQAELVQYRKLLRALRSLRSEIVDPGTGLVAEVLAALDDQVDRHGLRAAITPRRAAYLGGIAAATAAGVGTAAFVLARRRAA